MGRIKLSGVLAASALALAFTVGAAFPAAAGGNYTCKGGSPRSPSVIPAGTYHTITVKGFCAPADPGTVTVEKSLTVAPGGTFFSLLAHARVTIWGSLEIQAGANLAIGCGPDDLPCFDDSSATSQDTIHGNLSAEGAALLIVHHSTIEGNVSVEGGGGGLNCDNIHGLHTPAYVDFSTSVLGGNVSIEGLRTCWDGFYNNTVQGNVSHVNNRTVIEDGNLLGGNTIARNLSCFRDDPRPHLSDFAPVPNTVSGHTEGQCAHEGAA